MQTKETVYVETSIFGYLTARSTTNLLVGSETNSGAKLARAIQAKGGRAIFQAVNVTMSEQSDVLFDRINREFGRLDLAFNNIAVSNQAEMMTRLDEGDIAETIDVNVYGTWLVMKYEIEQMLTNNGGAIVNNSGILSTNPQPKKTIESATKTAIATMTKTAALEYACLGIKINAIAPEFIQTAPESNNSISAEVSPDTVPMGRLGKPEEVAQAVVWLCSDRAFFTTGHIFPIHGGFCG